MKRFAIIGASALAIVISTSEASRAEPLPTFGWTGFYAGVQGGGAFGQDSTFSTATVTRGIGCPCIGGGVGVAATAVAAAPAGVPVFPSRVRTVLADIASSPSGSVGGGHVGYNFSTSQLLGGAIGAAGIFGIEGDVEGLDNSSTKYDGRTFSHIESSLQGSIRGRLGFGFGRLLVYGTGGAAFGDFKSTYGLNALAQQSFDTTRVGYTVGGGVGYALTGKWVVDVEYRYSDFGSFSDNFSTTRPTATVIVSHREADQRVEAGISYLFTSPVPIAVAN